MWHTIRHQTLEHFFVAMLACFALCQAADARRAMIFGITGQDGSYLAEFLLAKGYEVHGCKRRSSPSNTERINHIMGNSKFKLHYTDITDSANIMRLLQQVQPDEVYNLAAQSHVGISFELPEYTANSDALGTLRILEAIRLLGLSNKTKFFQASTSELFGKIKETPQHESTPFYPQSPYGIAKLYAYWITVNYREAHNIFAVNGILFSHESPRRGDNFVTKKITRAVAAIKQGTQETLALGNLDAQRDWGYAPDYVEAMWLMLQQETPQDLVIATGQTHSVREFVEKAFKEVGIVISWRGEGIDEVGIDSATGKTVVTIDPRYFRPTEVNFFMGDVKKSWQALNWKATTSFDELVKIMVTSDCKELEY